MKNFIQFREDLASGRPMKKPVSSNLLKQRAKDNEKALKSGFMKLSPAERAKESKRLGEEDSFMQRRAAQLTPQEKKKANADYKQKARDEIKNRSKAIGKMKNESARDNYDPVISDKRTKEKLKKAGLPPESPKVMETILRDVFEGKKKGMDGKACWKGYKLQGTKKKGNRTVDNCVPMSEEEVKPHKMYKGDKVVVAKNKAEHDKLNKQGYTHDDPKTKKVEEAKKPVVHSTKPDSLKMVKIKYNKPIKTKVTDIGPGGKEVVRKDWSEGIERDPKSNSFNRTKSKKTKVKLGTKNGKEIYGVSTAPQGLPSMKEEQIQIVTNLDFNESLGNLVTRGMDKVRGAIKDAEKRTGYKVDPSKNKHSNPVSGDNIRKRLQSQKKR